MEQRDTCIRQVSEFIFPGFSHFKASHPAPCRMLVNKASNVKTKAMAGSATKGSSKSKCYKFSIIKIILWTYPVNRVVKFPETKYFRKFSEILAKASKLKVYNVHSNSLISPRAVLKTRYFF